MKRIFLSLMAVMMAATGALMAQDYSQYYTDLPVEIEQVKPVGFMPISISIDKVGAVADGQTLCTEAIQKVIDKLAKQGGGHVVIPAGTWLTGPIELKSGINLHLEAGAELRFTTDKSLYLQYNKDGSLKDKCLPCIRASKCTNIGITGEGVINGQGEYWRPVKASKVEKKHPEDWAWYMKQGGVIIDRIWYPFNLKDKSIPNIADNAQAQENMRYHLVNILDSKNVLVQGVTLKNSPKFHLVPARCNNLIIDGVKVYCPGYAQNGDAMDIGNSQTVLVVNCNINCGDDGICMKGGAGQSGVDRGPNSDFLIMNDTVYEAHGGFVIGSEFSGGMRRLIVRNCLFDGTDCGIKFKSAPGRGGWCEDIYCYDIVMRNIARSQKQGAAILFETGYADKAVGKSATANDQKDAFFPDWGNITMRNIICANLKSVLSIQGTTDYPVHDVTIDGLQVYGTQGGFNIKGAKNITINGTISTNPDHVVDAKTCQNILFNGKKLAK